MSITSTLNPKLTNQNGTFGAIKGFFAFGAGGLANVASQDFSSKIAGKVVENFVNDIFANPIGWLLDLLEDNIK